MTYALSAMMNLKRITTVFIIMSWNLRRKTKVLVTSLVFVLSMEVYDGKFTPDLFDKRVVYPD